MVTALKTYEAPAPDPLTNKTRFCPRCKHRVMPKERPLLVPDGEGICFIPLFYCEFCNNHCTFLKTTLEYDL